jgi:hypothetical protein
MVDTQVQRALLANERQTTDQYKPRHAAKGNRNKRKEPSTNVASQDPQKKEEGSGAETSLVCYNFGEPSHQNGDADR